MNSPINFAYQDNFIQSDFFKKLLIELEQDAHSRRQKGGEAPFQSVSILKNHKLGALRLSHELGGYGLSLHELFQVLIKISAIDPDLAQIFRSHYQFVEEILRHPNQEFKHRWLQEIAKGSLIGNAFAEINNLTVGSGKFETRLIAVDQHFILSGKKYFTTGTLYSDYVVVRVGQAEGKAFNVIIPTDRAGVEIVDDWDGIGQRYTASGSTYLNNVQVFADEIIEVVPEQVNFKSFTQLYLHAIIAGILQATAQDAVALLQKRGRSFSYANTAHAAHDPIFLEKIGQISSHAFVAEAAVLHAAQLQDFALAHTDQGIVDFNLAHQAALAASQVKIAIEPLALATAAQLFDITGASSTKRSLDLDRHWRNIRTLCSHNPASLKAVAVGKWLVHQENLPNNPYF